MKQIFFSIMLLLAVAILSGYKSSGKNAMAEKTAKVTASKDSNSNVKPGEITLKTNNDSKTKENSPAAKPRILLMLTNDTGKAAWSPSLWWNYEHAKLQQIGC